MYLNDTVHRNNIAGNAGAIGEDNTININVNNTGRKTIIIGNDTIRPHTGNYMSHMTGNSGPIYSVNYDVTEGVYSLQRGRTYTASVWVHKNSPNDTRLGAKLTTGGVSSIQFMERNSSEAIQIGDWIQLNVDINVPANYTPSSSGDGLEIYVEKSSSADAWIDDLHLSQEFQEEE